MLKKSFCNYEDAAIYAKKTAINNNTFTTLKRVIVWEVEINQHNSANAHAKKITEPSYRQKTNHKKTIKELIAEFDDGYSIDYQIYDDKEYLEAQGEIHSENFEYSECMYLSEEHGWFYPD